MLIFKIFARINFRESTDISENKSMSKLIHLRYSSFFSVRCKYFYSGPDGTSGNLVWGDEEMVKSGGPFVCFNLIFIHSWTGYDTCSTTHGIGG